MTKSSPSSSEVIEMANDLIEWTPRIGTRHPLDLEATRLIHLLVIENFMRLHGAVLYAIDPFTHEQLNSFN